MCDCSENNSAPATMRPLHCITTTPPTGRLFILSGIFLLQHTLCLPFPAGVFFAGLSKFRLERLSPERNNETQFCLSLRASQKLPLSSSTDRLLRCLLSGGRDGVQMSWNKLRFEPSKQGEPSEPEENLMMKPIFGSSSSSAPFRHPDFAHQQTGQWMIFKSALFAALFGQVRCGRRSFPVDACSIHHHICTAQQIIRHPPGVF
jgi:hypothetical protein